MGNLDVSPSDTGKTVCSWPLSMVLCGTNHPPSVAVYSVDDLTSAGDGGLVPFPFFLFLRFIETGILRQAKPSATRMGKIAGGYPE